MTKKLKTKKYFVSYAYGTKYGNAVFDAEELTPKNSEDWIGKLSEHIRMYNPEIKKEIIILNIQKIRMDVKKISAKVWVILLLGFIALFSILGYISIFK